MKRIDIFIVSISFLMLAGSIGESSVMAVPVGQTKRQTTKRQPSKTAAKTATSNKSTGRKTNTKKKAVTTSETSRDIKRQAEATQQEIRRTKEEIKTNDFNISKGVATLQKLEGDIKTSRQEVTAMTSRVDNLQTRISGLETEIEKADKELSTLRDDYLKAVRKMRVARKRNSDLAFLFSSKDFAQAGRRLRYLKQFSEWKEKQSNKIKAKVAQLQDQHKRLAGARVEMNDALKRQVAAQNKLEKQHAEQDALVVQLRRNGEALRQHLAQKQAEANQLNSRVASLIAQEEAARKEAELREQQRREEVRRQEEARQLEAQRKKQEAEEAKRLEAERKKKEAALADASKKSQKDTEKKKPNDKTSDKQKTSIEPVKKKSNDKSYADARRRKPRTETAPAAPAPSSSSGASAVNKASGTTGTNSSLSGNTTGKVQGASGFESMRGKLPRPASGSFRVISPFGSQTLPDLPGVVYDNPGIDAEVARGANAQSVYSGKVSAVYVVPGFSTVVIVNHGEYYTVYGNLESTSVKVGDSVSQGQSLGRLAVDADNPSHSTIHFEVWKRREKMNPMSWIH